MLRACQFRMGFHVLVEFHLSVEEQPVGKFLPRVLLRRKLLRHMFLTPYLNRQLLIIFHRGCDFLVDHGFPTSFGKGPQPSLWNSLQAARVQFTISPVPNLLNYGANFIEPILVIFCAFQKKTS